MKLLHIGWAHPRNVEFIVRACHEFNIEYHHTNDSNPPDQSYDIIWAPSNWIDPDRYPTSKILFGPHFWVFPNADHPFFTQSRSDHASRCIYICLCDWVKTLYEEFVPKTHIPFVPFPFGLSIDSQPKQVEYDCLIYYKSRHPSYLDFVTNFVKEKGLQYKVYEYGSYELHDYLSNLRKARFVIWIGRHESQGFALEECLAADTPIYVYDVTTMKEECVNGYYPYQHHSEQMLATSAPYWNDRCGIKVHSHEEFQSRFSEFMDKLSTYRPLQYVECTLTDPLCFERILNRLYRIDDLVTYRGTHIEMVQRNGNITCYMDGELQSCESDEALYHESLVRPAMSAVSTPMRVLIVGGGEVATLREVLKYPTVQKVDMIDWDKEVVHLFQTKYPQWAKGAWEDPRVSIQYDDIMDVIKEERGQSYDVIIIDLFDPTHESIEQMKEVVCALHKWLVQDGAMVFYAGMDPSLLPSLSWFKQTLPLYEHETMSNYHVHIPSFNGDSLFILFHNLIDKIV